MVASIRHTCHPRREDSVTMARSPFPDDETTTELPSARARTLVELAETERLHRRWTRLEWFSVGIVVGLTLAGFITIAVLCITGVTIPR